MPNVEPTPEERHAMVVATYIIMDDGYIGSEISENQCKWAEDRLKKWKSQTRLVVE